MGMTEISKEINSSIDEPIKPKKRGRKPKNKIQKIEDNQVKKPKKRGRKPKEIIKNNNILNNTNSKEVKDSIIHLKTNSDEIEQNLTINNFLKYDPNIINNIPLPYDPHINKGDFELLENLDEGDWEKKKTEQIDKTNKNNLLDNDNLIQNNDNIQNKYKETNEISILNSNLQKKIYHQ